MLNNGKVDAAVQQIFCIDSRLDAVLGVGEQIKSLCITQGMSTLNAYQVQTAVSEGINNAILHAYSGEPGHRVTIQFNAKDDHILIEVIDFGTKLEQLPPDIEPALEAESGRGWWIMRRWMDTVDYQSDQECNRLSLTRNIR